MVQIRSTMIGKMLLKELLGHFVQFDLDARMKVKKVAHDWTSKQSRGYGCSSSSFQIASSSEGARCLATCVLAGGVF